MSRSTPDDGRVDESRRRTLLGAGVALSTLLAGCAGPGGESEEGEGGEGGEGEGEEGGEGGGEEGGEEGEEGGEEDG